MCSSFHGQKWQSPNEMHAFVTLKINKAAIQKGTNKILRINVMTVNI